MLRMVLNSNAQRELAEVFLDLKQH